MGREENTGTNSDPVSKENILVMYSDNSQGKDIVGRKVEGQLVSSDGRGSPSRVRSRKELVVFNSGHSMEEEEIPGITTTMDEEFFRYAGYMVVADSLEWGAEQCSSIVAINKFEALVDIQEESEKIFYSSL